MEKASTVGTYVGGTISILSGINLSDIGVVCGIALGVASFAYNIWYKQQMLKIAKRKGVSITKDED
jgi:hypothetical protein